MFTRPCLSCVRHTFKLPQLYVVWPGPLITNKVQHTPVLQLMCGFAHGVVTGSRYVFYVGIYKRCSFNIRMTVLTIWLSWQVGRAEGGGQAQ